MASLATGGDGDNKDTLIQEITKLIQDEQVLEGVEKFRALESELGSDSGKLDEIVQNNRFVKFAQQCNMELTRFLDELAPIGSSKASKDGWVSVTEEKAKYRVWYKEEVETSSYTFRVEGMVNAPLFNILSVIYEFELFKTWFPGINESVKEIQLAKFRFIVSLLGTTLPWPLWTRKSILYAYGDVFNKDSVAIYIREATTSDLLNNISDEKTNNLDIENDRAKVIVDESKYVNAKCLYGGFHVIPVTEDKTFIKFAFNFDPQFQLLPASFFNFLIQQTMIPLLGLLTKKAKNIEGTEYEKRINSAEKGPIYEEIRKRLTKIDYTKKQYTKYLLQSQIDVVEERLAKALAREKNTGENTTTD